MGVAVKLFALWVGSCFQRVRIRSDVMKIQMDVQVYETVHSSHVGSSQAQFVSPEEKV